MSSRRRVTSHVMQKNQICLRLLVQIMETIWRIQKRLASYVAFPYWLSEGKDIIKSKHTGNNKGKNPLISLCCSLLVQDSTVQNYCTNQVHPLKTALISRYDC